MGLLDYRFKPGIRPADNTPGERKISGTGPVMQFLFNRTLLLIRCVCGKEAQQSNCMFADMGQGAQGIADFVQVR